MSSLSRAKFITLNIKSFNNLEYSASFFIIPYFNTSKMQVILVSYNKLASKDQFCFKRFEKNFNPPNYNNNSIFYLLSFFKS